MKNILIIGGSGFIGRNIVETLVGKDFDIFLISRQKHCHLFENNSDVKIIEGSLSNISLIKNIIMDHNIELILHLASNLIPSSIKREFDREIEDIVLPTFELIKYISEKNLKIIFFSSGGTIYGRSKEKKINETCQLAPINYYGFSKLLIENYIKMFSRTGNLKYVILRPSNVYGKYQRAESKQGFISVAIGRIRSNQVIEIWGDGTTTRDYIDVSDVAFIVQHIVRYNIQNKIFNIGSSEGHSLMAVLTVLEKCLGKQAKVVYKEKRKVDVDKIVLDISKLQSCIKFRPKKLDAGIKDFIANILKA